MYSGLMEQLHLHTDRMGASTSNSAAQLSCTRVPRMVSGISATRKTLSMLAMKILVIAESSSIIVVASLDIKP